MSLLASDPAVALDRVYPYENRYLTYLAKFVVLMMRREPVETFADADLCQFHKSVFGPPPWSAQDSTIAARSIAIPQRHAAWLRALWQTFSAEGTQGNPGARFYAEKTSSWVAPMVRDCLQATTIYLFRDPRDVYLSANAFMRKGNYYGFGRESGDTDLDHARSLSRSFTEVFENYWMSRRRDDCLLVRYEELLAPSDEIRRLLDRQLGIRLRWDSMERIEAHQTAPDLNRSAHRWKQESISAEVCRLFEKHLRVEMECLGFEGEAAPYPALEFRSGRIDSSRIERSADGELQLRDEYAEISTGGPDFWIILPFASFDAAAVHEVWVSLNGMIGDVCSLYWRGPDEGFAEERSIHLRFWPGLHWQVIRFRSGQHPLWKGTIAELRLDPFNVHHTGATGTGRIRWVRLLE